MPFESLSYRFTFSFNDFPERWLPLIYLYDPDLPLFPIFYFHVLDPSINLNDGPPGQRDRIFGYIEKINILPEGNADVTIVTNKNLEANPTFRDVVGNEVRERFGLNTPVTRTDILSVFRNRERQGTLFGNNNVAAPAPQNNPANRIIVYLWDRIVTNSFQGRLPFGRLWDPVFGLARFVASFYSPGGRKSEFIMTHYFVSRFGEQIQSGADIPQIDFFLLPTYEELRVSDNDLPWFRHFYELTEVSKAFQNAYCELKNIGTFSFSFFNKPTRERWNANKLIELLKGNEIPAEYKRAGIECFNAFDKGPLRPLIFLLMLDDLRNLRWDPDVRDPSLMGSLYEQLDGSYQSPKVIELYCQQCFGNPCAFPIDNWMETIMKWPLNVWPVSGTRQKYQKLFENSNDLGKVERLLWFASQARKVHSSTCNDVIWCIKYGDKKGKNNIIRGANPLSCKICSRPFRDICPAYSAIKNYQIDFNTDQGNGDFVIKTNEHNNTSHHQKFISCSGKSTYQDISDTYSVDDAPDVFLEFPQRNHRGETITMEEFIRIY